MTSQIHAPWKLLHDRLAISCFPLYLLVYSQLESEMFHTDGNPRQIFFIFTYTIYHSVLKLPFNNSTKT